MTILQLIFPTWHISTHILSSISFRSKVSYYRSLIHDPSRRLLSYSSFDPDSAPEFPDATPWLSRIFSYLPFSLFTIDNLSPLQTSPSSSITFHRPFLQRFINHNASLDLQVDTSIINPNYSIPEPQLLSSSNCFNGWFGIPFAVEFNITHIRSPQPSDILSLYHLHHLIPLYPFLLSVPLLRQLVLHIITPCFVQHLSIIILSPHPQNSVPYSHNKCISYCFHLRSMPSSLSWKEAYASDKETPLLLHHFLHKQPFAKNALSFFPAQYRRDVATNSLCMVEGRLVFFRKGCNNC